MKCPKCGQTKYFIIDMWELQYSYVIVTKVEGEWVHDNSYDSDVQESAIRPKSHTRCHECKHQGVIGDFDDGDLPDSIKEPPTSDLKVVLKRLKKEAKKFWRSRLKQIGV